MLDDFIERAEAAMRAPITPPKMLEITPEVRQFIADTMATGKVKAAGYRLKIFPIEVDDGLKAGEKDKFSELAKLGFKASSDRQAMRETRGSDHAIIVDVGPGAWKSPHLEAGGPWAKVGMVIRYLRYAGLEMEEPPGSGMVYRIINDEDCLGFYEPAFGEK